MTENTISAFKIVKDQVTHTSRVVINASDPLILYTDASTKATGGVLMQVQGGNEKPCVFVSHRLSDQATRSGGGDGTVSIRFCLLILLFTFLVNFLLGNGSQEPFVPLKFDRSQSGKMEGPFPSFWSSVFKLSTFLALRTWLPMV